VAALIEAQSLFFARIPAMFMIEQETAQEKAGTWPEACRVTDGQLMTVRAPRRLPKDGWNEAWLQDSHARYSVLRMPGCQRTPAPLPQPTVRPGGGVDFMIGVTQVVPGGLALVQRHETATNKDIWMLANVQVGTLEPIPVRRRLSTSSPTFPTTARAPDGSWSFPALVPRSWKSCTCSLSPAARTNVCWI